MKVFRYWSLRCWGRSFIELKIFVNTQLRSHKRNANVGEVSIMLIPVVTVWFCLWIHINCIWNNPLTVSYLSGEVTYLWTNCLEWLFITLLVNSYDSAEIRLYTLLMQIYSNRKHCVCEWCFYMICPTGEEVNLASQG